MATTTLVYRVQPAGLPIASHRSETSCGDLASGCHVFGSLSELCGAVCGWCDQDWQPEIVEIGCDYRDLADNGDYEGYELRPGRGTIVRRVSFQNWDALIAWAREFPDSL